MTTATSRSMSVSAQKIHKSTPASSASGDGHRHHDCGGRERSDVLVPSADQPLQSGRGRDRHEEQHQGQRRSHGLDYRLPLELCEPGGPRFPWEWDCCFSLEGAEEVSTTIASPDSAMGPEAVYEHAVAAEEHQAQRDRSGDARAIVGDSEIGACRCVDEREKPKSEESRGRTKRGSVLG